MPRSRPDPCKPGHGVEAAAFRRSIQLPAPELIGELSVTIGSTMVAYLGGVRETRAVRQWVDGTRAIRSAVDEERLRLAHQIAAIIASGNTAAVVRSWFGALNPALEDRSPAAVLRDGTVGEVGLAVLAAARAFAGQV